MPEDGSGRWPPTPQPANVEELNRHSLLRDAALGTCENVPVGPTVLRSGPYRFFFFASDRAEPVHVHVAREDKTAKFWLSPVRLAYNFGFAPTELTRIEGLVREHEAHLLKAWDEYFKPGN